MQGLWLAAWDEELGNDVDREFILKGIEHGFDIIDPCSSPTKVELDNHPSADINSPSFQKATAQILEEVSMGNYRKADEPPLIVSPLGVIPKRDGGVRLIHDCSRPVNASVNSYAGDMDKQRFQSVDSATKLVTPNAWMAKLDLKSAYRSVSISKHSQKVTGLKWILEGTPCYFIDTKLPFGSKLAPNIFHRLTQAVKRIMSRKGFTNIVVYLDDFFICEPTMSQCAHALAVLVKLIRKLGFLINWNKVVDPTQTLTFLGVEICTKTMEKRLPMEKLLLLRQELANFASRTRVSKRQLQSLIGKLSWAAAVVYGGRVFLRRIINAMTSLTHKNHKLKLQANIMQDINWWLQFMSTFNGKALILTQLPVSAIYTDACSEGAGGHWGDLWFYCNWQTDMPKVTHLHINEKEVIAVALAAARWAPLWSNHRVYIFSDNAVTVASINKGTSRNNTVMGFIRYLFWLSAKFNFHITARHIPGQNNTHADMISRLHDPAMLSSFLRLFLGPVPVAYLGQHMSYRSLLYLLYRGHRSSKLGNAGWTGSQP